VLRPSTAASLEAQAALADTRLPPRMVLLGLADAEAPGADGVDPYVVDAVVADTCSPPRMAALFADAEEPGADGVDPSVDIATTATDVEAPGVDGVDPSVVAAVGAEAPRADGVDAPVDAAVAAPDNIDAADIFFDSLRLPLQGDALAGGEEQSSESNKHNRQPKHEPSALLSWEIQRSTF